jgi:CubicO group peptidase (beta-lactamase class C family)
MGKRLIGGLIGALMMAATAGAEPLMPLPLQPAGVAWPVAGWETGELPASSKSQVEALVAEAMGKSKTDLMGETRGLVIIWRGRLVAEAYAEHFGPETKQISWSMAKSITQGIVGRAVQLGLIADIDQPMPSPYAEGSREAAITWRQWMQAVDGLDYHELDGDPDPLKNDTVQLMYGDGRFDAIGYTKRAFPLAHEPGTYWTYSTPAYHMIGRALQTLEPAYKDWQGTIRGKMIVTQADIAASETCDTARRAGEVVPSICEVLVKVRDGQVGADEQVAEAACQAARSAGRPLTPLCTLLSERGICRKLAVLGENMPGSCRTIEQRLGVYRSGQSNPDLLTNLFAVIGMKAVIESDPKGTYLGGSLVWASARDFAKFGYLYLRGGVWNGVQVLPEGWVDFARSPGPAANTNVYGAGWWIIPAEGPLTHRQNADSEPRDAFHAGGHEGQTIWVVPSRDLVIVRLGLMPNEGENWPALYEWNQRVARAFPVVGG